MKKTLLVSFVGALGLLFSCSPSSDSSSISNPIEKTQLSYFYKDYSTGNVALQPACPSVGSPKILVIPVWFTDSNTYLTNEEYKNNVREDMSKVFFGTPDETGWHSVASYYKEESQNKLTFTGTVASSWFECGLDSTLAGANSAYSMALALGAVEWYFANNPEDDRTSYDLDKDGYIDAVSLIYAAPDRQSLGDQSLVGLWAYCSWISEALTQPSVESPNPCTYFWSSYDFMYGEENALERTGGNYHNGGTDGFAGDEPIDAHTFIHEFGHVLGLDDYYDVNLQYSPAGGFSMEDYNVGGHDPFSVMALGWANPYIPSESCSITIRPFQNNRDFILLTPEWNIYNSPFDEYLLLELYTPTGLNELDIYHQYKGIRPTGATETGIRLWHVDARLAQALIKSDGSYELGEPTSNPYPEEYNVFKAFPNTYYKEGGSNNQYCSVYGYSYSDYNTLQLIRNDKDETYRPTENLENDDLFKDGDTFSMSSYSSQFVQGDKLNTGIALGWSFSVSIDGSGDSATATINCVKA